MGSAVLGQIAPVGAGLAPQMTVLSSTTFGGNGVLGSNLKSHSGFFLKLTPKIGSPSFHVRASIASSPQYTTKASAVNSGEEVRIAVLGGSGYTGAEIVRLLANHPHFRIKVMTADRKAGEQFGSVFPHLITQMQTFQMLMLFFVACHMEQHRKLLKDYPSG